MLKPFPSRYGIAVTEITTALRDLLQIIDLHAGRFENHATMEEEPERFMIAEVGGLNACMARLNDCLGILKERRIDLQSTLLDMRNERDKAKNPRDEDYDDD